MYPGDTPGSEKSPQVFPVPSSPSFVFDSSKIRRFLMKEEKEGADMEFSPKAGMKWSEFLRRWPVGQVVKTAASHAVNIGSNPVRVTIFLLTGEGKVNIMRMFSGQPDDI